MPVLGAGGAAAARRRGSMSNSSLRSSTRRGSMNSSMRSSTRSSVSRRDSLRSSMGCGSLIAAMEDRLQMEDESNSSNDSAGTTSGAGRRMSLAQSSRNMFLNIAILTSDAPIPDTELRDMGAFPLKKDPKPRRRRRRYLGMKPPKDAHEGDGLFRV